MPHTHCFTLPNGLRCAVQYKKSTVAHMAVAIKAGSRDELEHQQGLAHFIEHNLFKGTEKRKAYHVLSRLDDVGGELNAYTTKEETIIHASFLKTDFRRALVIQEITDAGEARAAAAQADQNRIEQVADQIDP